MRYGQAFGVLGAVLAATATAGSAAAQPAWDQQKGTCDAVFLGYEQASVAELKYCLGLWEAYRDVSKLTEVQKAQMGKVFNRVYKEGDPEAQYLAKNALARLGFTPAQDSAAEAKKEADAKPARKRYRPHTAAPEDQKAAEKIREKGMALYKKKDWDGAAKVLEEAREKDPASIQVLYDLACSYALGGDKENALENLRRLSDIATDKNQGTNKAAIEKLRKARTDRDFEAIRDEPDYKLYTGYARIKVVNGMKEEDKELGDDNVFKLIELLRNPKLAYKEVNDGGNDKHARDRPHIWFKEPSRNQAYVIARIIGHPKVRFVPIDWDTPWDIIVSWADKVEVNKDGEKVTKYAMMKKGGSGTGQSLDPEKRMDQALYEQDQALKEPDAYARKAKNVLETPDRMQNKVESAQDRIESTQKNFEKVGEKAGKLFK